MADILEDDADAAAMAEAMGFSGFGSQRPAKRKFNANADAATDLEPLPEKKKGGNVSKTGANNAPLGARRQLPVLPAGLPPRPNMGAGIGVGAVDSDEIDLGEGEEGLGGTAASGFHHGAGGSGFGSSKWQPDGHLSSDIDATSAQPRNHAVIDNGPPGLPARPPQPSFGRDQNQRRGTGGRGGGSRGGSGHDFHQPPAETGPPWWEGYHDARMNENPWEKLEAERGLQPRGTWVARNGGQGRAVPGSSQAPDTTSIQTHAVGESVAVGASAAVDAVVLLPKTMAQMAEAMDLPVEAEP